MPGQITLFQVKNHVWHNVNYHLFYVIMLYVYYVSIQGTNGLGGSVVLYRS